MPGILGAAVGQAMTTNDKPDPVESGPPRPDGASLTAHLPLPHLRLFEQLKQRNVFRVAALYLVVCWLILEPVHVVFHMMDVPLWADRLVIMIMAVGFPAAVIFAWVFEITPEGLKATADVPHGQSIRPHTGRRLDRAIIGVLAVALAYFVVDKFWISAHVQTAATTASKELTAATDTGAQHAADFNPPAHSIAVLPFINLSGDQTQEYFSDGLTEELLNSLAEVNGLQVAARTSAFSFKGTDNDIGTIARKLNVASILEGSVRRSEHKVRVTAQLINAVTGFHLWSKTYDRDLGDVLALQTEIANAVADALKITLLGNEAAKIELGGTHNPEAFDAYLRGARIIGNHDVSTWISANEHFTEALRLDPSYAVAYASRSLSESSYAAEDAGGAEIRENFSKARDDAEHALKLTPDLADAHLAMAQYLDLGALDVAGAQREYRRAIELAPGNVTVLATSGRFAALIGDSSGVDAARRAVVLDPLNPVTHQRLSAALYNARQFSDAVAAGQDALALNPSYEQALAWVGLAKISLHDLQGAQTNCEAAPNHWLSQMCLAIVYDKLGRRADAEAQLKKMKDVNGDDAAFQYAQVYAQWGDRNAALGWLETALKVRDPGLLGLKSEVLLDPVRDEPRFQAVQRAMKFPE
jgi:TolB-like protein/tetratricopeptide (TPR) repeat protein